MIRTQIFLTRDQHRQLKRLAQSRGQTCSSILRSYLDQALGFSTQQKFLSVLRDVAGTVPMDRIKDLKRRVQRSRPLFRKHGVVLVSARGPVPRLVEAVAGGPVPGSWWGHPKGKVIFAVLEAVTGSPDILVCRLVGGKITLVHRRLWPALVRAAGRFPAKHLARVRQQHSPSGRHVNREVAFPKWAPAKALRAARSLGEAAAIDALGPWARLP